MTTNFVAEEDLPPLLLADHPALDFLNTVVVIDGEERDWLGSGTALLSWLTTAHLFLEHQDTAIAALSEQQLEELAVAARDLREWLRGFVRERAGQTLGAVTAETLTLLNQLLAIGSSYVQVTPERVETRLQRWGGPSTILMPVAEAIVDLLCRVDFARVRHCEGEGCRLYFLDINKAGRRRWCSMSVCGNRAKVAAYRSRVGQE